VKTLHKEGASAERSAADSLNDFLSDRIEQELDTNEMSAEMKRLVKPLADKFALIADMADVIEPISGNEVEDAPFSDSSKTEAILQLNASLKRPIISLTTVLSQVASKKLEHDANLLMEELEGAGISYNNYDEKHILDYIQAVEGYVKKNKSNQSSAVAMLLKDAYEGKVAMEALRRAGQNKNLHGIVHEVLFKDLFNANPRNVLTGTKAVLTKSQTAIRDDILIKKGSAIVKRLQLKDTAKSINSTVKQVKSGHYARTNLVGTKETTAAFKKAVANKASKGGVKVTQQMKSSGISSNTTTNIAGKALGKMPSAKTLAASAKGAGAAGAVISGGIEAIVSGKKLLDGEISGGEYAKRVAKEGVGGGISAAASTAAGTAATAGAAMAATAMAVSAPAWVPVAVGIGVATGVGIGVKKGWDKLTEWI
jgi:hypothetical protein